MIKQFYLGLIFLLFLPALSYAEVTFDNTNERVSIKSDGRYLSEILLEISEKAGIDVFISPDADKQVFIDAKNKPLDRTIQNMVRPLSVAIVYSGESVKEVYIFGKSMSEATAKVVSGKKSGSSKSTVAAVSKKPRQRPSKEDLQARARERRRQMAETAGTLEEFEAKEAKMEEVRQKRELRRQKRLERKQEGRSRKRDQDDEE